MTEEGFGLLIMAIAGGALSALQGVIADRIRLQLSYLLPAACSTYCSTRCGARRRWPCCRMSGSPKGAWRLVSRRTSPCR